MTDQKEVWRVDANPSMAEYLREVWHFRSIAGYLAWRDIIVRFKQTVIGVLWVLARPLLVAIAFVFVFGRIAGLPSDGAPYLIFVLAALLPWQFFSMAIAQGAESIVANAGMITKIYFPRCLLPASAVLGSLFDFVVMLPLLAVACVFMGFVPSAGALFWVPFYALALAVLAFGIATLLATLNALYRDVRHLVPFLIQFGLFVSPIGYGVGSVPESWRTIYCLNPLVGLFEGLRVAFLGTPYLLPGWALPWSLAVTVATAVAGVAVLLWSERRLVDVI